MVAGEEHRCPTGSCFIERPLDRFLEVEAVGDDEVGVRDGLDVLRRRVPIVRIDAVRHQYDDIGHLADDVGHDGTEHRVGRDDHGPVRRAAAEVSDPQAEASTVNATSGIAIIVRVRLAMAESSAPGRSAASREI